MTSQHLTFYFHTVDAKRHYAGAEDALVSLLDCDVPIFVHAENYKSVDNYNDHAASSDSEDEI